MKRIANIIALGSLLFTLGSFAPGKKAITVVIPAQSHVRIQFGAEKLAASLKKAGYVVTIVKQNTLPQQKDAIVVGLLKDPLSRQAATAWHITADTSLGKEGFAINADQTTSKTKSFTHIQIAANAPSGALYGCMELADRIARTGALPEQLHVADKPEMVLRGACVGLQKPYYLPGHNVYEYPYTPETFSWFYDKQLWINYLDSMVENRMNSLYLWNGHPFASLVKLKDYPYAVEVDDATFKKNEEIFRFLTTEADKRGIWVIQMFYNIIVSRPFADHNHMKTQDRERPIIPIIADYTRKSITAFVQKYPNVGLMVALGEAMEGVGNDDIEWFTKTIIPGVKDGLKLLGKTEEPPIVLRAHDTDGPAVMKAATPLYKNLYVEAKYNGEALTTYTPRGPWAELHRTLSKAAPVLIENVHIMANLEPFRYGSADFIQKSVNAMHDVHHGNALHLYPQASYWDWPYTADSASPYLLQIDRDWIWYKEWSRYAWNCHRDRGEEVNYWAGLLGGRYGCAGEAGKNILEAYEQSGEIAPKLLRRFGITDGNRQTLTLGMLMSQLVNPERFGLFTLLYDSEGPEGEMLKEYAMKEWLHQPHVGETPVQIIEEVKAHGQKAVEAIDKAAPYITADKAEFERLKNDIYCYRALANHYAYKAEAALCALRYRYSGSVADLQKAQPLLQKSVEWYRTLVDLTKGTYRYANSMQTQQRKIPMRGVNGTFKTWVEMLPVFEKEVTVFTAKIDSLQKAPVQDSKGAVNLLPQGQVSLQDALSAYALVKGGKPFTDSAWSLKQAVAELAGLKGIQIAAAEQLKNGTVLHFTATAPVQLLVGFFQSKDRRFLQAPELETNATANDYGQAEIKIANGLLIDGMPAVNIHSYSFAAGTHTLTLGKGICVLAGFTNGTPLKPYDASLDGTGSKKEVDWLFE